MNGMNELESFELRYHKMQKEGSAYYDPASKIGVYSPGDGMCFFDSIATLAHVSHDPYAATAQDALCHAHQALMPQWGREGHTLHVIELVCAYLNLNWMKADDFVYNINLLKTG